MTERVEIHHIKHISGFNDKGEIYSRTMPIEWVGLMDEEILRELERVDPHTKRLPTGLKIFAHYLEAKLREKNHYA